MSPAKTSNGLRENPGKFELPFRGFMFYDLLLAPNHILRRAQYTCQAQF